MNRLRKPMPKPFRMWVAVVAMSATSRAIVRCNTLIPFSDEDEAVRIANATPFGLVAAVFTQDSDRALRVSRRIRAGAVFVNNYQRISIGTGFGGVGHSGFGREHAQETLAEYGYAKTIRLAAERDELTYWSAATRVLAG
jgi:hypothetical protein